MRKRDRIGAAGLRVISPQAGTAASEPADGFPSDTDATSTPCPGNRQVQKWEFRSVEPGLVRVGATPLSPSREVVGVIWDGEPLPLNSFLEVIGEEGWDIVAAGNIGERHHRLYLRRPRLG